MFERLRTLAAAAAQAVRGVFQRGSSARAAQRAAAVQQQAQAEQAEYRARHAASQAAQAQAYRGRHAAQVAFPAVSQPGYAGGHAASAQRINQIMAAEINNVRNGADSLFIRGNAAEKVNVFFAATRDAWQGYPVEERYDRIIAKTGAANLREAFEKVMADQEAQGVFAEDGEGWTDEEPPSPESRYRSLPYSGKKA